MHVCMYQMRVDVIKIPIVEYELEAVLIDKSGDKIVNTDVLDYLIGTIGYEIKYEIKGRILRSFTVGM